MARGKNWGNIVEDKDKMMRPGHAGPWRPQPEPSLHEKPWLCSNQKSGVM